VEQKSFIEVQFPVSKVSKESYKERMSNYSQTLTGLGKWWGRKPLVLVRATILGLLLPATDQPEKDREVFLSLMTMDEEGLWARKVAAKKKITAKEIYRILLDEEHEDRIRKRMEKFGGILPGIDVTTHDTRKEFLMNYLAAAGDSVKWKSKLSVTEKDALEKLAFEALYYDEKLDYCVRPEHLDGPSKEAWKKINEHLGTEAQSIPELVEELGKRRFGHRPRVGDAFCGGGSIPFEAARIGCDVYASDLNPVAALLTWAALNIVGGGPEVAEKVRKAQEEIYAAVDRQVTEWGIEHNKEGHRADAYLYCVEVEDPETGWKVPLAPSWVIGEKTKTVAILEPVEKEKRYRIRIKMGASPAEMKAAKQGTVQKGYVVHPKNKDPVPMSLIRRENKEGLRLWENEDVVPRPTDVFQERLYCIRWVIPAKSQKLDSKEQQGLFAEEQPDLETEELAGSRYYAEPTAEDLAREELVLSLLKERFAEWQKKGFIPSRKIEPGEKTTEPIRTRGWTHWHHLFNPRQLLVYGLFETQIGTLQGTREQIENTLEIGRLMDLKGVGCRLLPWNAHSSKEMHSRVFTNQALNTVNTYCHRSLSRIRTSQQQAPQLPAIQRLVKVRSIAETSETQDIWITDPPYADAVNYHELSEFFLAWYAVPLARLFPDWALDTRRSLAIKGQEQDFRLAMVQAYSNLSAHMPPDGMQVVMFTHQDAGVWADLALILWASGLRVTSCWTIATETTSALKEGNYVQGTALLVLRKNNSQDVAFLDELVPRIESEVRNQVDSMEKLEDKEEPNFSDNDYQLAAYAAALRVLTAYGTIQDLDVEKELSRGKAKGEKNKLEAIIEEARDVAASIRIPEGISRTVWNDLSAPERFYLRGLVFEAKGENRTGAFQELARSYGVRGYAELLGSVRANEARVKSAAEFAERQTDGEFGTGMLRKILYALYTSASAESADAGRTYLRTEMKDYWQNRQNLITLLGFLGRFQHTIVSRKKEFAMAEVLAGLLENDAS
jgi:putative DNA methylase